MSVNVSEFNWTAPREKAAVLVAEDEQTDKAIAAAVGITERTLERWKQHPTFTARVAEHVQALEAEMLKFSIAKRRKRVAALDDRWKRMQALIAARAEDLAEDIGGGDTGLLVHQVRAIGNGENQQIIDQYAVDTGLLKELREHEKQAAQELGQWTEKTDVTSGGQAIKAYIGVDVEAV